MGKRGPKVKSNIAALPAPRQQRPMPLRGMSEKGRAVWDLAREARVEVRKVVWPSRQETTQTTQTSCY